ncbi:[Fe-Fe] hydrogenase large subunit C-terminal domain-containing protein [Sporomusa acidovorans]|uniref:Iron hydrogenase large subunit C-terminal domain-containing protein n=1 Tax=Sporomusa acidovorans (strain ATCC 49682 / DSM 3132 / Mol) TaxID=1123286 RepID=A0ABZ3J5M9_SPOA4|nr:[Fe-Fe] hydrogenase large subunit C-terminal domain-containing protein [Sporomusa acidovorans]OZC15572.1 iron hydrogenase 1 [Sporomusa acidovorans DSM 3132]SDE18630.1 Iron only hydrogenase large subunit, C-terminal domain [Sporomusa acidovorans]
MAKNNPPDLNIRPRILYQVAKAAWEGQLFERKEEICHLLQREFEDKATRRLVANQIRLAMGLEPNNSEEVINEYDEEALMGMGSEPAAISNLQIYENCQGTACETHCPLSTITRDELGQASIDKNQCKTDDQCAQACRFDNLTDKSQFVPLINLLRQNTHKVYASVAPAFAGQFGAEVTAGKLRSALLKLGFSEMVETALYADLVTIKEAFEYNEHVKGEHDFLITSCCCPIWIKLIENKFPDLMVHISPSVSPMIASGRVIKELEPDAKVVFIGPCIAKKSEAQLPDLKGAIDFVLTFQELATILEAATINPASEPDEENPVASWGGRIYARTGGVSAAVGMTLEKLIPRRAEKFNPIKVDGIPDCTKLLEDIRAGKLKANFIEGMACKGGCVGGPGRLLPPEEGTARVNDYGNAAPAHTPVENPQVYSILAKLGHYHDMPAMTGTSKMATILARKLNPAPPK